LYAASSRARNFELDRAVLTPFGFAQGELLKPWPFKAKEGKSRGRKATAGPSTPLRFAQDDKLKTNAQDAIIFTAKRTLRERWRQIVTEGAKELGFFLATIDEKVSEAQIREMKAERIHMVVPSRLKKSVPQYTEAANVITFEDFLEDHLDPKMTKWKKHGDIS
jgi:hypothetical protein